MPGKSIVKRKPGPKKGAKKAVQGKGAKKRKTMPVTIAAPVSSNNALRTCVCSASATLSIDEQKKCKKLRREMEVLMKDQEKIVKSSQDYLLSLRAQQGTVRCPKCFCDQPQGQRKHCEKVCKRQRWLEILGVPFEREGVKNPRTLDIRIAKIHFPLEAFVENSVSERGIAHLKDTAAGDAGVPDPNVNFDELAKTFVIEGRRQARCLREVKVKRENLEAPLKKLTPYESILLAQKLNRVQSACSTIQREVWEVDEGDPDIDDEEWDSYIDARNELQRLEKEKAKELESYNEKIKAKLDELEGIIKPSGKKRYLADSLGKPKNVRKKKKQQQEKKPGEFAEELSEVNKALEQALGALDQNGFYWLPETE